MSGLTSAHLSAAGVSSGTLIGAFSPEQISHLNAPVNGPTTDYSLMQHFMTYIAHHPETVEDFTDADMSFFTPEAVSWFPAGFVAELPAETFAGFTADQISNLSSTRFREHYAGPDINISPEQISHITLDAMSGLTSAHLSAAVLWYFDRRIFTGTNFSSKCPCKWTNNRLLADAAGHAIPLPVS